MAEIANLPPGERWLYNLNMRQIWDSYAVLKAQLRRAEKKGEIKGEKKGINKGIKIGEKRGEIKGKVEYLLMFLSQKFGSTISPEIEKTIKAMDNVEQIDEILSRAFEINNWETLKKYLSTFV